MRSSNQFADSKNQVRTPTLLNSKSVAEVLSIPESTLRYWRKTGVGPRWIKLEGSIRYDLADVLQYIESGRRTPSVRANMEENDVSL
jgi:predicted DNA-binding transcriptional regulator AlpA